MSDEAVREIQLSGKQLIFLFMIAAAVLVVTFLFGVLVGRGVRPSDTVAAAAAIEPGGPAAAGAPAGAAPPPVDAGAPAQPPATPPAPPREADLGYYSRLEAAKPGEPARAAAPPPATASKTEPAAGAKAKPEAPVAASAGVAAFREPPGSGYALRVAAYRDKAQADALAARLAAKGYSIYVVQLPATAKGPGLFSVRAGKYRTQKEATAIKRRLEKEEKLKPSAIPR